MKRKIADWLFRLANWVDAKVALRWTTFGAGTTSAGHACLYIKVKDEV